MTKIENFFPNLELGALGYPLWDGPIDLEFGPDGSLYVLEHEARAPRRASTTAPATSARAPSIAVDRSSGGAAPLTVAFDGSASDRP